MGCFFYIITTYGDNECLLLLNEKTREKNFMKNSLKAGKLALAPLALVVVIMIQMGLPNVEPVKAAEKKNINQFNKNLIIYFFRVLFY